jgi:hypothetical protein
MVEMMIPDLSLWRRAVAVFGLFVLVLATLVFCLEAPPSQAFIRFNASRIHDFRAGHGPKDPGALRIVMLGNSRLKNATLDAALFDRLAHNHGLRKTEIFRLVANWAVFSDFETLLDEVRALNADVYVIQLDLLTQEKSSPFRHKLAFQYLRWLTAGTGEWTWHEPVKEQLDLVCTNETEPEQRSARATQMLVSDLDAESPKLARRFIHDVAGAGTAVVLISIPKSNAFEQVLPSATPEMLGAAREIAAAVPNVTVSPYVGTLPDDNFCDVTHLNSKGAGAFSRWLVEQIASVQVAAAD